MCTINKIYELISGNSALSTISERFTLMSNAAVSLPILLSCETTNKFIDHKILPADAILTGSKWFKLHLFHYMEVGACCDQTHLQKSLGVSTQHMIVVSIVKHHNYFNSKEEVVTTMENNREEPGHDQKGAVDKATKLLLGERIFQLFL